MKDVELSEPFCIFLSQDNKKISKRAFLLIIDLFNKNCKEMDLFFSDSNFVEKMINYLGVDEKNIKVIWFDIFLILFIS